MDMAHMCPHYERAVEILGKKWTALILRALMDGPRRFAEISGYVEGLSDRLLSERLQELEKAGIVDRHVSAERPVRVEYTLTQKGADLRGVVEAIQGWASRWGPASEDTVSVAGAPPPITGRSGASLPGTSE